MLSVSACNAVFLSEVTVMSSYDVSVPLCANARSHDSTINSKAAARALDGSCGPEALDSMVVITGDLFRTMAHSVTSEFVSQMSRLRPARRNVSAQK
jgi:hypothetical protein